MPPETSPPARDRVRRTILPNVRAHGLARAVEAAGGIVLVPLVLAWLPREAYGFWVWALATCGLIALADFGLSQANVRPLVDAMRRRDDEAVSEIVSTAIVLHLALAALPILVAAALLGEIASLFPAIPASTVRQVVLAILLAQGIALVGLPFGSILSAAQRLDLIHKIRIAAILLRVGLTVLVIQLDGTLEALAAAQVGVSALSSGLRWRFAVRLHPSLSPSAPDRGRAKELARLGGPLVVLSLVGTITLSFEQTALGFFVDLADVAQYAVALRLVLAARQLPGFVSFPVVPATALLDDAADHGALAELHRRSVRGVSILVAGLTAILIGAGPALLRLWVGPGFEPAAALLGPLAVGILFPMAAAPGVAVLTGQSRIGDLTRGYLVWAAAFVAGNLAWLGIAGFAGAGLGLAAVNIAGLAWLLGTFRRRHPEWGRIPARVFALPLAAAVAAGFAVAALMPETLGIAGRLGALADAAAWTALFGALYTAALFATRTLSPHDLDVIRETIAPRAAR